MGLPYTVVAVAEGAKYADGTKVIGKIVEDSPDPVRYSGLAAKVADDLEKVIPNHEVRSVNPGHIIRGGDITAYDRIYLFVMAWLQLNLLMKVNLVM